MAPCTKERAPRVVDNDVIAIAPFRTSGADKSLAYLRYGLVDFLSAELSGDVGPRAVEPGETQRAWERARLGAEPATEAAAARVARQLGAGQVVFGSVVGTSQQITIIASILNTSDGTPRGRPLKVVGSADSLPVLVADLSSKILGRSSGALRMTGSLPDRVSTETMREFLAGREAYRRGAHAEAAQKFSRVLELDSSFVYAAYWLTVLAEMEALGARPPAAAQRIAWTNRSRLGRDERDLLEASIGANGSIETGSRDAIRLATLAVAERTNSPEAWAILGETYLHYGALLGIDDWLSRARFAFERGYASDTTVGLGHMGLVTYLLNDVRGHSAALARLTQRSRNSALIASERYLQALMLGNRAGIQAAADKISREEPQAFYFSSTMLPSTEVEAVLERIERSAACCGRSAEEADAHRRSTTLTRVHLATNGGRSGATAARLALFDNDTTQQLLDALKSADEDSADVEHLARRIAINPNALGRNAAWAVTCEITLARLRRADTTGFRTGIATLQQSPNREARVCAMVADAIGASLAPGTNNAALWVADSIMRNKTWHTPSNNANPHWNYDLALAFARRGDYRSAAFAARRRLFARRFRLGVSVRDEGRWFLMAGDTARAMTAFQSYLKLRDNPQPTLVPERDSIRTQLAAITPRSKRTKSTR
jgi:tetratricopeptide (TPR) repeat protein